MYRINDKSAAIKTVQKYLSKIYGETHIISQNGIFDENTVLALNKFQNENNLETKKYIDYQDFVILYDLYVSAIEREKISGSVGIGINYPISRGYRNHEMINVNRMLLDITRHYGHFIPIKINDYFSFYTLQALEIINDIFGMEAIAFIDENIHSRIIKEWKSIQNTEYFP